MSYLVQKTRAAQLTIGGQDYTSSLVSFAVSDASAFNRGLMTTSGALILGQKPGGSDIQDYDRNVFRRGVQVVLDMENPDGTIYRHPRGLLYVLSVSYSVESEQLSVEIGCRLSLAFLTDNAESILPLVPVPLDPAQQTVQNCSASFAASGKVLYQDNQGNLVSRTFFGTDSTEAIEEGAWVSVLDSTALSVAPLSASGAIPDEIELSYQVPSGALAADNGGKVDTVTETSNYFLNYPATVWQRNPNPTPTGEKKLPDTVNRVPGSPGVTGSCGQTLSPPTPGGTEVVPGGITNYLLCSDEWTTDRTDVYLPATRTSTSTSTYGGPAGQISLQERVVTGPEVEANPGYFADKYAYCVATYSSPCNPSGSCEYYGLASTVLSKQVTTYEYGTEANELVRTVQDNYETVLSAYTTSEYRSGVSNGVPQEFNQSLSADQLYRSSRVITDYFQEGNVNVQVKTTYNSITSRGVGPSSGSSIDALNGIKSTVRRESVTVTTLDIRPDAVNSGVTSTEEKLTRLILSVNGYTELPPEAGEYISEESIPVPLLFTEQALIDSTVNAYSNYIVRFTRGDAYGLRIAESMRSEIVDTWYPGMPFRYVDTANDVIMALRMDACTWGVTQDEAIVVTNGIWIGYSNGTLVLGSNLSGNSRPDVTDGNSPTPPTGPTAPPSIQDDQVGQGFSFDVRVNLYLNSTVFTYFEDGVAPVNPTDFNGLVEQAIVPYCDGFIVAAGGLLETSGTGSIPFEYAGSIVTTTATVVEADLFAAP